MPRKRPHKQVPISGEQLKAALDSAGLSIREAAKHLPAGTRGESSQNLDNIVKGKQHRCHPTLRDELARLLDLPNAEWLGSEQDLPDLPWWGSPRTIGRERSLESDGDGGSRIPQDLNQRAVPGTTWCKTLDEAREFFGLPPAERGGMPPRYQLLAWRLARDIEQAWSQSFGGLEEDTEYPETVSDSEEAIARRVRSGYVPLYVLPVIAALLSLSFWRRLVMDEPYGGLIDPDGMECFAAGMEQAARTLLRPWLDGKMEVRPPKQFEAMFIRLALLGEALVRTELHTEREREEWLLRRREDPATKKSGTKPPPPTGSVCGLAEMERQLHEAPDWGKCDLLDHFVTAELEQPEPRKDALLLFLETAKRFKEGHLMKELTAALRNLDDAATEPPPWRRPPEETPTTEEAPT